MSMLDRYRKTGGFRQLIALIETCNLQKQEKFLELIRNESPVWAEALKAKKLSILRIYSWDDETLAKIFAALPDLTVSHALHGAPPALKERILKYMSHGRQRKIDDIHQSQVPTVGEISAAHIKIIEAVRKMANLGDIRLDDIDPDLHFNSKIEETLAEQDAATTSVMKSDAALESEIIETDLTPSEASASPSSVDARSAEILMLKRKLAEVSKENALLRQELSVARNKLEQIRKIA